MMENSEKKYYERSYKLALENTKYNSEGKAVITLDDEWREEKEWDAMFNQIQMVLCQDLVQIKMRSSAC